MVKKSASVSVSLIALLVGFLVYSYLNTPNDNQTVNASAKEVVIPVTEIIPPKIDKADLVKTFRITAYCACEKCCGKWASNRPLKSNGEPLVVGASGKELISGVSCASPLPFGTKIKIDGVGTLEVHDRTADWIVDKHGEYIADIYFNNHEEALAWGVKYIEGEVYYAQ